MLTPIQFPKAFTSLILGTRSGVVDVLRPFCRERMMAEVPRKALKADLSESHFTSLRLSFLHLEYRNIDDQLRILLRIL